MKGLFQVLLQLWLPNQVYFIVKLATYPLDLIRKRMQCDGFYNPKSHDVEITKKIYQSFLGVHIIFTLVNKNHCKK